VRHAPTIELSSEERTKLSQLARSKTTTVRLARRAQMVLLAAEGLSNAAIAAHMVWGVCRSDAGERAMPKAA